MQSLGNILNFKAKRSPIMRSVVASMVVEKANHVLANMFGEHIIDFARAVYLKNKALTVACLSSVSAQEIRLHESKIVEEINKKMGDSVVDKIKYLA
ncbi:MAG: DciA family protein [bacterium]|nr:DUF721 domain-containing protein [Patescibacteria group bacterium]